MQRQLDTPSKQSRGKHRQQFAKIIKFSRAGLTGQLALAALTLLTLYGLREADWLEVGGGHLASRVCAGVAAVRGRLVRIMIAIFLARLGW